MSKRMELDRMWENNTGNIKGIVRELLNENSTRGNDCVTENDHGKSTSNSQFSNKFSIHETLDPLSTAVDGKDSTSNSSSSDIQTSNSVCGAIGEQDASVSNDTVAIDNNAKFESNSSNGLHIRTDSQYHTSELVPIAKDVYDFDDDNDEVLQHGFMIGGVSTFSDDTDTEDEEFDEECHDSGDELDPEDESSTSAVNSEDDSCESVNDDPDNKMGITRPPISEKLRAVFCEDRGQFPLGAECMDENEVLDKERTRSYLKERLPDMNVSCVLRFYGYRKNTDYHVMYAKCRYRSHAQRFKFDIGFDDDGHGEVFIYSTDAGEVLHSGRKQFYQLRGTERTKNKEDLQGVSPRNHHLKVTRETNLEHVADGNMQKLRLLSTYQKAKSEETCKYDLTLKSREIGDLIQQCQNDGQRADPYLRRVGVPLQAIMYSKKQLFQLIKGKMFVLHLDATGSVVRIPNGVDCKRILYYALVAKFMNAVIPLAEMVSSEHNTMAISYFLMDYRRFVQQEKYSWPAFECVVVDWTWAYIHALMEEWNDTNIREYLEKAYDCARKNIKFPSKYILIQTCCPHFMHRVADNLDKNFPEYAGRDLILDCMAFMIICKTLDDVDSIFDAMMIILLTPDEIDAESEIAKLAHYHKFGFQDATKDSEVELNADGDSAEGIAASSPFHRHYMRILNRVEEHMRNLDEGEEAMNPLYSPSLAFFLVNHFMAFLCIWSGILFRDRLINISRLSNVYVELHFKVVKETVLEKQLHLPIARFIRKVMKYVGDLVHSEETGVPLKSRKEPKPVFPEDHQFEDDSAIPDEESIPAAIDHACEETWRKKSEERKRKRRSHLDGHNFGKCKKARTSQNCEHHIEIKATRRRKGRSKVTEQAHARCEVIEEQQPSSEDFASPLMAHSTSLSPLDQSDNSVHEMALENGLFPDVSFYLDAEGEEVELMLLANYTVDVNSPIFPPTRFFQLPLTDFQTLKGTSWLGGNLIDCYAIQFLKDFRGFHYVPAQYTCAVFGEDSPPSLSKAHSLYKSVSPASGRVMFPYLFKDHWRLLIIDIDQCTLMVIDPVRTTPKRESEHYAEERRARQKLENLVANSPQNSFFASMKNIKWKIVRWNEDRPFQNDGTNCGVYLMYFIRCIGSGIQMEKQIDTAFHRRDFGSFLSRQSLDMRDYCLYCYYRSRNDFQVMCSFCRRFAHHNCIPGEKKSRSEWESDSVQMICVYCSKGRRDWMQYPRLLDREKAMLA